MNDYETVRGDIASFIGTPEGDWDTRTATDVNSAIRKGINSVIHNALHHQWTWMRPTHRFSTSDGVRRYALPADFEQFIGDLCFDGDNYQHPPIIQKPAARLHQFHSEYSGTGVPEYYALESRAHDGTTEQVQEVVLQPTPDGEYQLLGIYQVGPIRELTSQRPWFPGGPANRELFIAACLAKAESIFMDGPVTDKQDEFNTELVAAVSRDQKRGARILGQMGGRRGVENYRWKLQTQWEGHVDSV